MKVVLFCGGLGMRMREGAASAPKPMHMIGDRPLLWHVMRYYAHFGHTDFILCLGYGAAAVKEYFLRYDETQSNDFTMVGGGRDITLHSTDITDWNVTFIDTGLKSTIGERLVRVRSQVGTRRVPRELRRHAYRRAPRRTGRPPSGRPTPSRSPSPFRPSPPTTSWTYRRRRSRHHRRTSGPREPCNGKRRLLRAAAGHLRRPSRGPRTWCRRRCQGCSRTASCARSATPASGAPPTRSRTRPSWKTCSIAGIAPGCCGMCCAARRHERLNATGSSHARAPPRRRPRARGRVTRLLALTGVRSVLAVGAPSGRHRDRGGRPAAVAGERCPESGCACTTSSSTGSATRRAEAEAAASAFLSRAELTFAMHELPDGRLPAHSAAVKEHLHEAEATLTPDLLLCPRADDAHQDHRLVGELVPTVFRRTLVLHYEIPKWDVGFSDGRTSTCHSRTRWRRARWSCCTSISRRSGRTTGGTTRSSSGLPGCGGWSVAADMRKPSDVTRPW